MAGGTEELTVPLLKRTVENDGEEDELGLKEKVWIESKKLWVVAAPAIFTRFSTFGVSMISQAFIGHLGPIELAAYSITFTVLLRFSNGILNRWPRTVIILITPPPIDEKARLRYPYIENTTGLPERTNEAAGLYANACVAIANECQILVIDLWSKMQQIPNWQTECLWDGLHLSRVGNKIVFEEVANKLKEEGIGAEDLAVDLPLIEDVDPKKPLRAFDEF